MPRDGCANVLDLGHEGLNRHPGANDDEVATPAKEVGRIMTPIGNPFDLAQVGPDAAVAFVLFRGDIGEPPKRMPPTQHPATCHFDEVAEADVPHD